MLNKLFLFLIILILLSFSAGCKDFEKDETPKETTIDPIMVFCPREDCNKALVDIINSAQKSVYCAFFDLDLKEVIDSLGKKSQNIDVKVVIDEQNNNNLIAGPGVRFDDSSQLTHNKFCVVDGYIVTTGSFNPTQRDAHYNNNNLIIFSSIYLAKNYEEEFYELWDGSFGKGKKVNYPVIYLNNKETENYFCPDDKCSEKVANVINSAKKSVYFMVFSFTKEEIADAILFKDDVEIKGIFDKTQSGSKYSQYWRLKDFGIDVKLDKNKYFLHHKVFIIDNETVITGSFNPSSAGEYKNDENIVIIHDKDIAGKYLEEFDYVWNQ